MSDRHTSKSVGAGEVPAMPHYRRCGFRFSVTDAVVIAVGVAATWFLWDALGDVGLLPAVVVFHFFLFCNVFRIRRRYELIWAGAFVVNLLAWQAAEAFAWRNVLLAQTPLTAILIVAEMRGGRYHGVAWRWINPRCRDDFRSTGASS